MKTVYVGMVADLIHPGHINILKIAAGLGKVMVGLLSDAAVGSYKRMPVLDWEARREILLAIKYVDTVVVQNSLDYVPNLLQYKPDILVHGDDWRTGVQAETRQKALECLEGWNGVLIEPAYTSAYSTTEIIKKMCEP